MQLRANQPIHLTVGEQYQTPRVAIHPLTDTIQVRLQRPTTAMPLAWDATSTLRVTLVLVLDGQEQNRTVGYVSGGVRLEPKRGGEIAEYRREYRTPVCLGERAKAFMRGQHPDARGVYRDVPLTRMSELATTVEAYVLLECVRGSVETVLVLAETTEAPAPTIRTKNSVAYDNAASDKESGGDGTLAVALAPAGSTDLAAFFCTTIAGSGTATETGTVDASATNVNELWQLNYAGYIHHAAYTKTGIGTGSKTYEIASTDSAPGTQFVGVVTMTGVHQTPGSEYAGVNTATGSTTSPSATATSVTSDDLVVASLGSYFGGDPSIPAEQNARIVQNEGADYWHEVATQAGTEGGAMTWTLTGSPDWALGAVTVKASASGDISVALSGSASTAGRGTPTPGIEVPL